MRKQRNGDDTQRRVLEAAQRAFAEKGFSATSLADISKRCGISDGLILHHFKNKSSLYHRVLENEAEKYASVLLSSRRSATGIEQLIKQTIEQSFDFWKKDKTYNRLALWAYLEGVTGLSDKESALTVGFIRLLGELQDSKTIGDRFCPLVLLTVVMGSIMYWQRYREQYKCALNLTETAGQLDRLFLDQLSDLAAEMTRMANNK